MKLLTCLMCIFSSMQADECLEHDVIVRSGVITELDYDAYENLYSFKLDRASRWEVEYFEFYDFNWEIGDSIKIYYQEHIYDHFAENLDKQNSAYLIHIGEN